MFGKYLRKPVEVDEFALARAAERAARAEALLRDEELQDAFFAVESVYVNAWRTSDALDVDLRERSWVAVQLLSDLKHALIQHVREGSVANDRLAKLNTARERDSQEL